MGSIIERTLRIGEMRLAQILCDLEDYLSNWVGRKKAEDFVNRVEEKVLKLEKSGE